VQGGKQGSASGTKVTNQADLDEALDLIVPDLKTLHVEWTEVVPGQRV
jgi:hypothetical protein